MLTQIVRALRAWKRYNQSLSELNRLVPKDAFAQIDRAAEQTPEQVYALAKDKLADASDAQAIYFQGGPLDPIQVLQRIEDDLGVPVIASNPTMLWHICTKLGLKFNVPNAGRLLREWPDPIPV